MSKAVDSFYTLYNNPFLMSEIVIEFYKHYDMSQKNDVLLSYIVLPLSLYEPSKIALKRANTQRSIRTFVKAPERLFGLADRVIEYKKITNMAIQFALDKRSIIIDEKLSIHVNTENLAPSNTSLKAYLNAAANLAKMLKGVDIVSVYRQLGIKKI